MPDLYTIPETLNSSFYSAVTSLADSVATRLTALAETPLDANRRYDCGNALAHKAWNFKARAIGTAAEVFANLQTYMGIITPAVFVQSKPEHAALGPALAYDAIKDDISASERAEFVAWAEACMFTVSTIHGPGWYSIMRTEDFALKAGTAARRCANLTPFYVGGIGALLIATGLDATYTTEASVISTAMADYLANGFDATNGDSKEAIIHYPMFGLAAGIWYGDQVWDKADWDNFATYLKWIAWPSSPTHGFKAPAIGDTPSQGPGLGDFAYWYGGDLANDYRLNPSTNPSWPMAAAMWAPATGTAATPGGSTDLQVQLFDTSGQVVLRQRTDAKTDFYLACHVGNDGAHASGLGHDHADRGQVLFHHGRPWFFDPGGLSNPNPKRGTDHSQVLIDGIGQGFSPHIGTIALGVNTALYSRVDMNLKKAYDYRGKENADESNTGFAIDADGILSKSWNPVEKAIRKVAVVNGSRRFVCVYDNIKKDASSHTYKQQWAMPGGVLHSSDQLLQKGVGTPTSKKVLRPGTGTNADLVCSAGQCYGISQYDPQAPSNYRFNITYSDSTTQTGVAPYNGDNYGFGSHPALNAGKTVADITRLAPVGRPVALVASAVATPSGWTDVTNDLPLRYWVQILNCGSGSIGSEVKLNGGIPGSLLTVTQTGTDVSFRVIFVCLTDYGIDPQTAISVSTAGDVTTLTIDVSTYTITWGGDDGILVAEGSPPAATTTHRPKPLKGKRK